MKEQIEEHLEPCQISVRELFLRKKLTAKALSEMFHKVLNIPLHKDSLLLHAPSTLNFRVFLLYLSK